MKWHKFNESDTKSGYKRIDHYTSNNLFGLRNDANGKFNDTGHGHNISGHFGGESTPHFDIFSRPNTNDGSRANPTYNSGINFEKK